MKRLLVIAILFLALSITGFAQLAPEVPDQSVQDFIRSITVQVIVRMKQVERDLSWYKYSEGQKLSEQQYLDLDENERKWYNMGYKVEYGEWSDKYDKDNYVTSRVCGSGYIIYSKRLSPAMQEIEGVAGKTLIQTNAHVVEYMMDRDARGTRYEPLDIYAEEDLEKTYYPLNVTPREGSLPKKQVYYKWVADYVTILSEIGQQYLVKGSVVGYDLGLDVAVIQLDNVWGLPYAIYRPDQVQVGEKIYCCGAPLGNPFSFDEGKVNQVNLDLGCNPGAEEGKCIIWDNQIKHTVPSAPGSSGSGLYDVNGYLIGEHHGVQVYANNYISGGELGIDGVEIQNWLIWNGFAEAVDQSPCNDQIQILENFKEVSQ